MSMDSVPKDLRGLRACKLCSMVKVSPYIYSKAVDIYLHVFFSLRTSSTITAATTARGS